MNIEKLKAAEFSFFEKYPGGFMNPEMIEIGKKHKMDKHVQFAEENFAKDKFSDHFVMLENLTKMVSRSSMVSVFEKPKFRDTVRSFTMPEQLSLLKGVKELLHGDEEKGFSALVDLLVPYKLAKWTLLTVFGVYYRPEKEVFCKPTTVKNSIAFFELEDLNYKAKPDYDFYVKYRNIINKMKTLVDPNLSPSNAAFSGFLMMVMNGL